MERTFLDLRIARRTDGGFDLKQEASPGDPTDEHWIVIAAEQLETLARMGGFLPAADVDRACERLAERLRLLAALVRAHTTETDPLRAAVAALLGEPGGEGVRRAPHESGRMAPLSSAPTNAPCKNPAPAGCRQSSFMET